MSKTLSYPKQLRMLLPTLPFPETEKRNPTHGPDPTFIEMNGKILKETGLGFLCGEIKHMELTSNDNMKMAGASE